MTSMSLERRVDFGEGIVFLLVKSAVSIFRKCGALLH